MEAAGFSAAPAWTSSPPTSTPSKSSSACTRRSFPRWISGCLRGTPASYHGNLLSERSYK